MSYDIRLNSFSDAPASEQQLVGAFEVLTRYGAQPFERGFSVRWEDGSGFTMFSESLSQRPIRFYALLNPLGDLSPRLCDFAYDFAAAIDCAIYPDVSPPLTVIVHSEMMERLPHSLRMKTVVRVASGIALRNALAPSYYAWREIVRGTARRMNDLERGGTEGEA